MMTAKIKQWFTVREAAEFWEVCQNTIRKFIRCGALKTRRGPTGVHKIARKDLETLYR